MRDDECPLQQVGEEGEIETLAMSEAVVAPSDLEKSFSANHGDISHLDTRNVGCVSWQIRVGIVPKASNILHSLNF
jgi:hypothetical protein